MPTITTSVPVRPNAHALPVLVVDDEPDDLFFVARLLRKTEISSQVITVSSGEAAVSYLEGALAKRRFDDEKFPGPILMDMKMPGMSGPQVVAWAKRAGVAEKSVIAMHTSSSLPEDVRAAYEAGAHAYFVKYPAPDTMKALVEIACNRPAGTSVPLLRVKDSVARPASQAPKRR